jgi:hypothetical protein
MMFDRRRDALSDALEAAQPNPVPAPSSVAPDETRHADRLRLRTAWLSDLHLGTPGCQAVALPDFLRPVACEALLLVGDTIDGWQLRRQGYWPQARNDVVQKPLRKARKGTHVISVPGNLDEFARRYLGRNFGGIDVVEDPVQETSDGRHPSGSQQWRGESLIWQTHPTGDARRRRQGAVIQGGGEGDPPQVVDTLGGRMHVRRGQGAAATPHGQWVFFAECLAATGVFERWCRRAPCTTEAATRRTSATCWARGCSRCVSRSTSPGYPTSTPA